VIRRSGWQGRVISTYRPDPVVDPEHESFRESLGQFANISGMDVYSWRGYLEAHRVRRAAFAALGTTATDHGHPTAATADPGHSYASAGSFAVELTVQDKHGNTTSANLTIVVSASAQTTSASIGLWEIAIVVVIVLAVILFLILGRRRKKEPPAASTDGTPAPPSSP